MSVDIIAQLDELIHDGVRFQGAVLLTYSLNLQFFEQLIQPRLDALGCGTVLIVSDVFGYQEAVSQNLHQLSGVGRRYVCAPLPSQGRGVQHSKVLMLISETRGWMLVGSGNLTFYGYGQNLELFDQFEFNSTRGSSSEERDTYPFQQVWRMVEQLTPALNKIAQEQFNRIRSSAAWVTEFSSLTSETTIWHSFDTTLFERLAKLTPVEELHLIAPFIDVSTVERLLKHFKPKNLIIGVNGTKPNIDGRRINGICQTASIQLEIRTIHAKEPNTLRGLHAKAIIGIHRDGAWCVSGSANITRPALCDPWNLQGNLETVVYRASSNRDDFLSLWEDSLIRVGTVTAQELQNTTVDEDVSESKPTIIHLKELVERGNTIEGEVVFKQQLANAEFRFELILSGWQTVITFDHQNRFTIPLESNYKGPDAGKVVATLANGEIMCSQTLVIDQPFELERYGARAFHQSIRSKLDTVREAANTFKELMEFLFARVDREALDRETHTRQEKQRNSRRVSLASDEDQETDKALPISSFITEDELNYQIGRRIDALNPYDQDHYSLRDLLSLVLLRLTTETTPQRVMDAVTDNEDDEIAINVEIENQRQQQYDGQERLAQYLMHYCKRYGERLSNKQFILETGTETIFQNHCTLMRVLLEFHHKTEVFDSSHLREAIRRVWSPLFQQEGTLATLVAESGSNTIFRIWHRECMTPIFMALVTSGWSDVMPDWSMRYHTPSIQRFLYSKHLIKSAEVLLGEKFWRQKELQTTDWVDLLNYLPITRLSPSSSNLIDDLSAQFEKLAAYLTPIEQYHADYFRLYELNRAGVTYRVEANKLASSLKEENPKLVQMIQRAQSIVSIIGDNTECPVTQLELPLNVISQIRKGYLVPSSYNENTLIYWMPDFDENKVLL